MDRKQVNRLFADAFGENSSHARHFLVKVDDIENRFGHGETLDRGLFLCDGEFCTPFYEILVEIKTSHLTFYTTITNIKTFLRVSSMISGLPIYHNYVHCPYLVVNLRVDGDMKFYPYKCGVFDGVQTMYVEHGREEFDKLFDHMNVLMMYVQAFLCMCNHPRNSIVQRFPKEKKNDVNWVASRSHYLIIDNDESKTISHTGVSRSFDGTITRAMHARRAHFKTLRHERYKQNVGKRIWVRSCWVGPKEWEGTDEKIYRVVC